MSIAPAYTTRFRSLDNTLWEIEIYIDGYNGRTVEICLEGEEPCVIDWQETDKMDVIQSATCTLRVSNEADRQMLQLMNNTNAAIIVSRNGMEYWRGTLDDAVYEEPYSFKNGYVTELPFTDFGILNRMPFSLTGKQSVAAIVEHCLEGSGLDYLYQELCTSLLEPKNQQPITLSMLYINADRFATEGDSWGKMTMKRDVLEEVLRPLGLRIMQKNGSIHIYDIEYLRDHMETQNYVVWNGTDAYLKGSETFGMYEVAFEPDTAETLAEDGLDYDSNIWDDSEKYFANSYNLETETDSDIGFYLEVKNYAHPKAKIQKSSDARFFRTRSVFSDASDIGVAWRIKCKRVFMAANVNGQMIPIIIDETTLLDNSAVCLNSEVEDVFRLETGYLPLAPNRNKYQLRVNLDFLISFRPNPFDDPSDDWAATQAYPAMEANWENQAAVNAYLVPIILEVLDDNGNAVYHYENADYQTIGGDMYLLFATDVVRPFGIDKGRWVAGAGTYGQMYLAYYNTDNNDDPLIEKGWVTNRIASPANSEINGTLYRVRDDGEYVSLPPIAGRLRLTVGNGIFVTRYAHYSTYASMFYGPYGFAQALSWQLYRNPKITMVKANRREDGIDDENVYERSSINPYSDRLSETVKAGCWSKGIAPSSRGLFFDAYGRVWEKFVKNGEVQTLEKHRLLSIIDQTFYAQPVISGTAGLNNVFCAHNEFSTPGVFLVTALRQDLYQDIEEVTMARIANLGGLCYDYRWDNPVCVKVELEYDFAWSDPVCAKEFRPDWSFVWDKPVCVTIDKNN